MINFIKGALYGVAVGDALGAPLEFMTAAEIKNKHGLLKEMAGGGHWDIEPGGVTDDTQMTLCVAEGIVENPAEPIPAIGSRFIKWAKNNPVGIGVTCKASIGEAALKTEKLPLSAETWYEIARKTHHTLEGRSGGNGALMRTIYPALFYPDLKTAAAIAARQAKMTHWAQESTQACLIYTHLVHGLLAGTDKNHILEALVNTRYQGAQHSNHNPTGYVVDTMMCALKSFFTTDSFEGAVVNAVNLGGDADTIGAVTGGIAGALYGYENIPERWLFALDGTVSASILRLSFAAENYRNEQKIIEKP